MKVLILCGGRGARFDHETELLPKPLIEVRGKPMLGHIMDLFEAQGFDEFLIAGGYKHGMIDAYLSSRYECRSHPHGDLFIYGNKGQKAKTFMIDTGEEATTGDRVMRFAVEMFLNGPFFLTYGDGLCDVDLKALLRQHEEMGTNWMDSGWRPRITVTAVRPPGRFGVIDIGPISGNVVGFGEKPSEGWINGGFMVVDGSPFVLKYGPLEKYGDDESIQSFESGAMVRAAKDGAMHAFQHGGYWRCMDTRRDLEQIEDDIRLANGLLPWRKDLMW